MQSQRAKEIHQAAVAGNKETVSRLLPDATAEDLNYEGKVLFI